MKKIIVSIVFTLAVSFGFAQVQTMYNALGVKLDGDTVTNTGVGTVTSRVVNGTSANTLVWVIVTKISGTVAGTITLQGSIDGTNWKAANTVDTQTAVATITAADATSTYHWRLQGNPYPYYRISWTGSGTMAAKLQGRVLSR